MVFLSKMVDNYIQLVERIASSANLGKEDIERKVEAKRAKLSGLVSKEGAAQIVAAELGINLDLEKLKISELVHGMKRANVIGKIIRIFPVRQYQKNGREGKVLNVILADESSNIKTVLWDTNHISLFENGKIKEEDVIEVSNGGIRNGELHLSSFSDIKKSKEDIKEVVRERVVLNKNLGEIKTGESGKIRAFIVQVFEPRYFEVCPECRKKVSEGICKIHGNINSEKRALLNIVLDDGSSTMRAVIFGEHVYRLGLNEEDVFSLEKFEFQKNNLLGEEKLFVGNVRSNMLYNTMEFNVENIEDINADILIKELEAKL